MTLVSCRYATASVIARRGRNNLEFLVMNTVRFTGKSAGIVLMQFPMEKSEWADNGNPEKTLRAGVEEETGLSIKPGAKIEFLHMDQFDEHEKMFFLIWRSACRGRIRTIPIPDKRSMLGVPYWVTLEELEERLCETHRTVLPKLHLLVVRPLAA